MAIAAMVAAALVLLPAGAEARQARGGCANADSKAKNLSQGEVRRAVVCRINAERAGRRKLKLHRRLNGSALRHSKAMREHRCLLHVCPGEAPLARRLRRYVGGADSWRVAEVIAVNVARATPRDVVRQWMTSSAHRRLLLGRFEHAGVGVATAGRLAFYTVDLGAKG